MEGGGRFESLPWEAVVEILSRLHEVGDWGRCRATSNSLRELSVHAQSVRFYCAYERFQRSRRSGVRITPFKAVATEVLSRLEDVRSVRFDMEEAMQRLCYEADEGELSDYWLTDVDFAMEWLPRVGGTLRELSITDFWQQSCWRCTKFLSVISAHCKALCTLELRNSWLSVEGLQKMANLTSLTLEFIRLNDESLATVNQCFPALERLHLLNVGGLRDPCICMAQLRVCHWTVSNSPLSLKIVASKLDELKLECCCPERLIIETPLLTSFHLSMEMLGKLFMALDMPNLRMLVLHSFEVCSVIGLLSGREFVKMLLLELPILSFDENGHWDGLRKSQRPSNMPGFEELGRDFPELHTLIIGPGAWHNLEQSLDRVGDGNYEFAWKCLKKLILHMVLLRVEHASILIRRLLHFCPMLFDVEVYMHQDSMPDAQKVIISMSKNEFPHLRWKWKVWRKGLDGV